MLNLTHVTLRRGPRKLLEGVSCTIHPGWRVGVVGRNGTGKTSLFSMILGELAPDAGEVAVPRQLAIATVAQEMPALAVPAIEYVIDGDRELRALERELDTAERTADAHALGRIHDRLAAIDGYAARARAAKLLHGLGFADAEFEQNLSQFSGGWRVRLNLAQALMCRSDLLLLDEPTNHLDLDAVFWLQSWLAGYAGTLLLISHDREFLDAVTSHTLHLERGGAVLYSGNYSQFERQRAERLAQQSAQHGAQQRQIAHLQSFVERFRAKASKAKQAQARLKMIERIQQVAAVTADSEFGFDFAQPQRLPSPMIRLDNASAGYAARTVLSGIKLGIQPGDRIGLLGPNGAGKTTLVRLLAGELAPRAGDILRDPYLRVGYFAQHQLEQLDPAASALLHFQRLDPKASEQSLRSFLGGFNFSGERVFEAIAPFSGGEKARLALALLVYQQPNLLLLDEPTNHLDLDMRRALELALQEFAGAMVLVSHDRHLVASTCDTLWRVADGQLSAFDGDLDDYARWLASRDRRTDTAPAKPRAAPTVASQAQQKPLRDDLRKLETEMEKAQQRLDATEQALADPALYDESRKKELSKLLSAQAEQQQKLAQVEARWLAAAEQLEALQSG